MIGLPKSTSAFSGTETNADTCELACSKTPSTYKQLRRNQQSRSAERAIGGEWVELFYDLFFAAALAAYTERREMLDGKDIADFAMYFALIWWTWTSQMMYDVRFARYAKSEKVAKFLQLFVLIGFGVSQDEWSMYERSEVHVSLETAAGLQHRRRHNPHGAAVGIAVVFIASRLLLSLQYLRVFYLRKRGDGNRLNTLVIHSLLPFAAACFWLLSLPILDKTLLLGPSDSPARLYSARAVLWSIGILVEALGNFGLRAYEHGGFEHTAIVERFGALTVILLGEAVIKMVRYLRNITAGVGFSALSAVAIFASIISTCLVWGLHFHHLNPHTRISKFRAYAWIFLHFPLHLALVVLLEGILALLLWTNIDSGIAQMLNGVSHIGESSGILSDLYGLKGRNETLTLGKLKVLYHVEDGRMIKVQDLYDEPGSSRAKMQPIPLDYRLRVLSGSQIMSPLEISPPGSTLTANEYNYAYISIFARLASTYRVEPSHHFLEYVQALQPGQTTGEVAQRAYGLLSEQFHLSARLVLVTGGAFMLISVPLMLIIGRYRTDNWSRHVPVGLRLVVGTVLILLGAIVDIEDAVNRRHNPPQNTLLGRMLAEGVLLPTWTIAAVVVYCADMITWQWLQFWGIAAASQGPTSLNVASSALAEKLSTSSTSSCSSSSSVLRPPVPEDAHGANKAATKRESQSNETISPRALFVPAPASHTISSSMRSLAATDTGPAALMKAMPVPGHGYL
ncbi:hypothetical protein PYCC9005_001927 [Savitreella phatthalungensis]